jgi:cyclic-di-GMP-binding protein
MIMPSFDIVSKTNMAEVDNALAGITREVAQRFDFKGSKCSVERKDHSITVLADDDQKLKQMHELLKVHFTRRQVDPKALEFKTVEKASGNSVRQEVVVKEGVDAALAKTIVKEIKDSKAKVQVAIQGDELRVSGKKRDDLQEAIALVKKMDVELPLQFINFRD